MRTPASAPVVLGLLAVLALAACGDDDASGPPLVDLGPVDAGDDLGHRDGGGDVFHPGPYGTRWRDVAGPFTVPVLGDADGAPDATLDFRAAWTGDDSWFFVFYAPDSRYGEALWRSDALALLEESPSNVHYVFLSYFESDRTDRARERVTELRGRMEAALAALPAERAAHWRRRLHYVPVEAYALGNWISDLVREADTRAPIAFAIDRFQRIRQVGLLLSLVTARPAPELYYLAFEARHFDFERRREDRLPPGATIVDVVRERELFDGDLDVEVTLPDADTMATFDTLVVDVTLDCRQHDEGNCWEWDRIATLRLCEDVDPGDADAGPPDDAGGADAGPPDDAGSGDAGRPAPVRRCDVELARGITTYGREQRYVVDATPMLATLREGGRRVLRFNAGPAADMRPYVVSVALRLSNQRRGSRPVGAEPVWFGTFPYDAAYGARFPPVTFTPPAGTRKTELFALITGHGFQTEPQNCAEFCDHRHLFTVGPAGASPDAGIARTFVRAHPMAGTVAGCAMTVGTELGTVPNQYGTWPLGRGGWCPGAHVEPFVVDLREVVTPGAPHELRYASDVGGRPFDPVFTMDGYRPEIALSVWLVYSR